MKIIDNRNVKFCMFDDIPNGSVFVYENNYYMRIDAEDRCNAVDLCTGDSVAFYGYERIEQVKASLVIEYREKEDKTCL